MTDESRDIHAEGERLFDDALEAGRAIGKIPGRRRRPRRAPHTPWPALQPAFNDHRPNIAWAQSRIDESIQRRDTYAS